MIASRTRNDCRRRIVGTWSSWRTGHIHSSRVFVSAMREDWNRTTSIGAATQKSGRLETVQYLRKPTPLRINLVKTQRHLHARRSKADLPVMSLDPAIYTWNELFTPRPRCARDGAVVLVRKILRSDQP